MRNLGSAVLTIAFGWGAVAVLAALVWLLPLMPEPFWPVPLILAAVPLAMHLVEWRLMKRRAILSAVLHKDGVVRASFWRGRLLQIGTVLSAIVMMTALYLAASFLLREHWMVLIAAVVIMAVLAGPVRDALSSEVDSAYLGMIVRHGPLFWGGVVGLGAAFLALNFVLDQPDLRYGAFDAVLKAAYQEGFDRAQAANLGILLGIANAAMVGGWYWAQIVGPQLGIGAGWLFWPVFLLVIGGISSLLSAWLLAVIALAERLGRPASALPLPSITFVVAAAMAIGVLYASASYGLSKQSVNLDRIVAPLDPCGSARSEQAFARSHFAVYTIQEQSRTQAEIEAAVNEAFARLNPALDAYLDWHYSLVGEYSRLLYIFSAEALVAEKFDELVFAEGKEWLADEIAAIEARSAKRMREVASEHAYRLRPHEDNHCLARTLTASGHPAIAPALRHVHGAAAGGAVGMTAGVIGGWLGPRLMSRLGPRIAARLGAKGMFRAAAATAGAWICSPTGPGAALCGIAAGAATWLVVDVSFTWVDEILNRESMRVELEEVLENERAELIAALSAANAARVMTASAKLSQGRHFSPMQEGLGRPRQ